MIQGPSYRLSIARIERMLADGLFAVLLLSCVIAGGWLAARHDRYWDWALSGENRLRPESRQILKRLESPLRLTVFADPQAPIARRIDQFLGRYQRERPDLEIRYLDPRRFPEQARAAEVKAEGQILIDYRGRRETLSEISERSLSAAIARLIRPRQTWVAVASGHGERAIDGDAGTDLKRLGQELESLGLMARPLDLTKVDAVPDNARFLILTQPQRSFSPLGLKAIQSFIERGGSLLWLMDPPGPTGLEPMLRSLGLSVLRGQVVDPAAQRLGFAPGTAVIDPGQPLLAGAKGPAILPGALAFALGAAQGWTLAAALTSSPESWNELGSLDGPLNRDEVIGEQPGPLPVVLALSRRLAEGREQRIVVSGDGDFLSNAHLAQPSNRALALALIRWLAAEEDLPELPPPPSLAEPLVLSDSQRALIGAGVLLGLPGVFALGGLWMRWHRGRG